MNNKKSKSYVQTHMLSWLITCAVFSCFALFSVNNVVAEDLSDPPPFIGVVTKVSPAEGIVVVKTEDGKRQTFVFTEQTSLKGVLLFDEIKTKQKVKVWYVIEDEAFKALKIEVKPELGC